MSSEIAIQVANLSKCYQVYDAPRDRLKQFLLPWLHRRVGLPNKNYYREFWALKNVSFQIRKGTAVGIIGRNGSGKSTLLQIICGTVSQSQGSVNTHGRVAALLELGSGFNPEFTGRENVFLNASVLGLRKKEIDARFDKIQEFADIGDFIDQPVKTYSSGMFARLAFSIVINVDPEILIVDEALAVGDARFVAKCMRQIKMMQEQGVSILFVSHDIGAIRTLCESAIWLDEGVVVEHGDVFPVTGRFTAYMFREEAGDTDIVKGPPSATNQPAETPLAPNPNEEEIVSLSSTGQAKNADQTQGEQRLRDIDTRPVTHWGSHKGSIISAAILDQEGGKQDIFSWGQTITIRIEVNIPITISREELSVAFSIKDLKGTDLIVSTTCDFERKRLPDCESFSVLFTFTNPLVTGKYLLVVAVENRKHSDIHYYEYIEGAHYFASLADKRLFGLFQPPIMQRVLA